ncbi:MAG: hypothetical protein WC291_08085, partial [Thermodesulfovibrionales bacterium]
VVLFLSGDSHRRPKASGERLLSTADIIIVESPPEGMGEPKGKPTCTVLSGSPDITTLTGFITMVAERKEIEAMLREKAVNGKIGCKDAREIAETMGVPYKEVGAAANLLSIKIMNCELGCF